MSRFFFHLRKSGRRLIDAEGLVLADEAAARKEATAAAQDFYDLVRDEVADGWKDSALEVCDERGRCVFLIGFAAAVRLNTRPAEAPQRARPPELARLHAEFCRVHSETEFTVMRGHMLMDRAHYECKMLYSIRLAVQENRSRAQETLARSRQQSQSGGP